MGTWGPGILDNDYALDLKEVWKENLSEGFSPEEITEVLVDEAKENGILDGNEDELDFWFAMALIQWKTGRLQQIVLNKALEYLKSDRLIEIEQLRWEEKVLFNKRISHLKKLELTLNSDQPPARKISKPYKQKTALKNGDIFSIKLTSGNFILVEVIDVEIENGSETPVCILYNYLDTTEPTSKILEEAEPLIFRGQEFDGNTYSNFLLASVNKKQQEPIERIIFLNRNQVSSFQSRCPTFLCFWDEIDTKLEGWIKQYGLKN